MTEAEREAAALERLRAQAALNPLMPERREVTATDLRLLLSMYQRERDTIASRWSCGHARFPVALESHPECAICYKAERDDARAQLAESEAARDIGSDARLALAGEVLELQDRIAASEAEAAAMRGALERGGRAVAALRQRAEQAESVMRKVEWAGHSRYIGNTRCLICRGDVAVGHAPDCELAAAIRGGK